MTSENTWTRFMDMHSGGGCKQEPYEYIYIELPYDTAVETFKERFGHSPIDIECECCGENYSIDSAPTLGHVTAFSRGCEWDGKGYVLRTGQLLAEYVQRKDVLVLREEDLCTPKT